MNTKAIPSLRPEHHALSRYSVYLSRERTDGELARICANADTDACTGQWDDYPLQLRFLYCHPECIKPRRDRALRVRRGMALACVVGLVAGLASVYFF